MSVRGRVRFISAGKFRKKRRATSTASAFGGGGAVRMIKFRRDTGTGGEEIGEDTGVP